MNRNKKLFSVIAIAFFVQRISSPLYADDFNKGKTLKEDLPLIRVLPEKTVSPESGLYPYIQHTKALNLIKQNSRSNPSLGKGLEILDSLVDDPRYPREIREKILLTLGTVLYENGAYAESIQQLEYLMDSKLADKAFFVMIWGYVKLNNFNQAIKMADEFIHRYKDSGYYDQILMIKGKLYNAQNKFSDAMDAYDTAKKEFEKNSAFIRENLIQKETLSKLKNMLIASRYPVYQFSDNYSKVSMADFSGSSNLGKRILRRIPGKRKIYEDLIPLVDVIKVENGLTNFKMKINRAKSRQAYSMSYYNQKIHEIKDTIEKLNQISMKDLKKRIESESREVIEFLIDEKERFLTTEVESQIDKNKAFQSYLDKARDVFKKSDALEFFNHVRKLSLTPPFQEKYDLKKIKSAMEDMILLNSNFEIRSIDDFLSFSEKDIGYLTVINQEDTNLLFLTQKIQKTFDDIGSLKDTAPNVKAVYWEKDHGKSNEILSSIVNIFMKMDHRLFDIKQNIEKYVLTEGRNQKEKFVQELEAKKKNDFIIKKEVFLLDEADKGLTSVQGIMEYLEDKKDLFDRSDEVEFFHDIQKSTHEIPSLLHYSADIKKAAMEKLLETDLSSDEVAFKNFLTITLKDQSFLFDIEKENNNLNLVKKRIEKIFQDIGSLESKAPNVHASYWRDDHQNAYNAFMNIMNVSSGIQDHFNDIKNDVKEYITENGKNKKEYFLKRLDSVSDKIEQTILICYQLIDHLNLLISKLQSSSRSMDALTQKTLQLEEKISKKQQWMEMNFQDLLRKELILMANNYNNQREKAEFELAENFFEVVSRER